jgi:hypothetical protein
MKIHLIYNILIKYIIFTNLYGENNNIRDLQFRPRSKIRNLMLAYACSVWTNKILIGRKDVIVIINEKNHTSIYRKNSLYMT